MRISDWSSDVCSSDLVAFQVVAVLEGARLALVGIDRHEARAGKAAHDLPLLAGREAGAAEAAQAGVGEDLDELLRRPLVGEAGAQQLIAAVALVGSEVLVGGDRRAMVAGRGSHQALHRGVVAVAMADLGHRRARAGPHSETGRANVCTPVLFA